MFLSLILYILASGLGETGKEPRRMGNEILCFCAVLEILGDTLEQVESLSFYLRRSVATQDTA
ncbi:hypothetical protein P152DRAFT_456566, partial [Eremomyces bilateralis CBS 781.70]